MTNSRTDQFEHDYDLDLKSDLEDLDDLKECLVCTGSGQCPECNDKIATDEPGSCWYCDGSRACHACKGTGYVESSDE